MKERRPCRQAVRLIMRAARQLYNNTTTSKTAAKRVEKALGRILRSAPTEEAIASQATTLYIDMKQVIVYAEAGATIEWMAVFAKTPELDTFCQIFSAIISAPFFREAYERAIKKDFDAETDKEAPGE